ncbi:AP-2 complex subunit beta [Geodia barretti]|uniref:AP-2 complex subunit beta n=1 Tax=Geodia barretti TaxID=519541 RepID=A0AA35RGS1_GEOBA|nr:AP-2 complex subunit beta [Geodia barretti]
MAVCVYCKKEGSISLRCKQHVICQECLPENIKKFGYEKDEIYTCPESECRVTRSTAPRKRNVWIFADNSNIWIEAMKHTAERKEFTPTHDHRVRINYGVRLHPDNLAGKNRVVKEATLYGSVPPPVDTFWEKVRTYKWVVKTYERSYVTHKEKEVDTELVADVTEVVCKTPVRLRGTIIIISGDRDMRPAVEKALENGFEVEMYIWKNSTSFRDSLDEYRKKYPGRVSYQYLDDIEEQATYLNTELSENAQVDIYNCSAVISIGEGKTPEGIVGSKDDWNELETKTKWPVEYRLLKDGGKNRHLLLVFQYMDQPDLESLVEEINSLPYVEHCRLFTKSLEKTGVIDDDDGFKKIVGRIKPKKPGIFGGPGLPGMGRNGRRRGGGRGSDLFGGLEVWAQSRDLFQGGPILSSPNRSGCPLPGKGMEILRTFVRRGGQIYADMTFNNKAMQSVTACHPFNKTYNIISVFGLAPGPLAVNSPLMPNSTASTLLSITPGGLVMKMSPLTQLQVAIKNNVDVFYFSVNMPTHVLFSEDGTMDRKVFLATWKEIPQSNEVQSSVDNVSLTPDQVQQKLETNNVFLIARRQVDVGGLNHGGADEHVLKLSQ